jgi:glutaryl-CoA dehydrogenase
MQELERCDSGIRSFASVQGSLAMYAIFAFGTEEQRQRWLPAMARGELIGCFGLTEEQGGSDPGGAMRTRATPDGDGGYLLSGSKMWITNGTQAGLAIVWAITHEQDRKQMRGFVVERGFEGFSALPIHNKFSMRASDTAELVLEEVRVPASHVLPEARGIKAPLSCLTEARFGIAWGALGAAMACYEEALAFTTGRSTFGAPIGGKQLVQEKLVWMLTEITKCQLLCWRLGRLKDLGQATPAQVSMAKRDCVSMALRTARQARDILGASGITADFQAMRHMCNLESVSTYEGTHDIHTLIVGEEITGQRAF